MKAIVIFPHQLFEDTALLAKNIPIFLVEEPRFFSDFNFHKLKLMLHRASMKAYEQYLKKKNFLVHYIDLEDAPSIFSILQAKKIKELHYYDPVDLILEKRLQKESKKYGIATHVYETPAFMTENSYIDEYFSHKKHYAFTPFYIEQRKRYSILMHQGKPLGGTWSFDTQNRKKMPQNMSLPPLKKIRVTKFTKEAEQYVAKLFAHNPGTCTTFWFPTTHQESKAWLTNFLEERLSCFGDYQDAMVADQEVLFHSVLSPLLNCGLLTPHYVVNTTIAYAQKHKVPLNALEGFIRQILGWREFVRAVYRTAGNKQRTHNFWHHKRKLPSSFYDGSTAIFPLDTVIQRTMKYAYAHHIERLMIMGNFMLLCEIHPDAVYQWFMELYIDAYDWVMVPNVYGMSQYADGGLMTTKPYISSSNYILKMSNFKKDSWCNIWDALYWRFIYRHITFFAQNPRLSMMTTHLKKISKTDLQHVLKTAEQFLKQLR